MLLPVVTCESLVCPLQLNCEASLLQCVSYQGRHYCLVETFSPSDRLAAYDLACKLAERGEQMLVTASQHRYVVWSDGLVSQVEPVLMVA